MLAQQLGDGDRPGRVPQRADHGDMSADTGRGHRLVQRRGAANLDHMVGAGAAGHLAYGFAPLRRLAIVDQAICTKLLKPAKLLVRG
ncbi:hypothetical protein D3C72_1964670 [compost metagenome]